MLKAAISRADNLAEKAALIAVGLEAFDLNAKNLCA
jgi:hypothetical protein